LDYFSGVGSSELRSLINDIRQLQRDHNHQERDNESLVEKFFACLGYSSVSEIKFRRNNIDILIANNNESLITVEVKRRWSLNKNDIKTLRQAFNYSMESGTRYVMISNGDYYVLYDRNLGHKYDDMFKFEFTLTKLKEKDLEKVNYLRKGKLP
jgi:predicted type IV restriction endonuclease